jgi:hypothetical protein
MTYKCWTKEGCFGCDTFIDTLRFELHRLDGPALERIDDPTMIWYVDGKIHRENGPAIDSPKYTFWYLHDKLHREDGPAIEYKIHPFQKVWFLYNKKVTEAEFNEITDPVLRKLIWG